MSRGRPGPTLTTLPPPPKGPTAPDPGRTGGPRGVFKPPRRDALGTWKGGRESERTGRGTGGGERDPRPLTATNLRRRHRRRHHPPDADGPGPRGAQTARHRPTPPPVGGATLAPPSLPTTPATHTHTPPLEPHPPRPAPPAPHPRAPGPSPRRARGGDGKRGVGRGGATARPGGAGGERWGAERGRRTPGTDGVAGTQKRQPRGGGTRGNRPRGGAERAAPPAPAAAAREAAPPLLPPRPTRFGPSLSGKLSRTAAPPPTGGAGPRAPRTRNEAGGLNANGRAPPPRPLMILPQVHLRKPCYDFYFL